MASDSEMDDLERSPGESGPAPCPAEDPKFSGAPKTATYPRPWGPWATIGWTILLIIVMSIVQAAVLIIFVVSGIAGNQNVFDPAQNGSVVAAATAASTPVIIGLIALIVWARQYPIRDYLALNWTEARTVVVALIGLGVVLGASDLTTYSLGQPIVPPFMVATYRTAWLPFLLLAFVVLVPIGEETLFRGFLYKGIAASRGGPITAIVVSTVVFALMHAQYDWYGVLLVAVIGLYLAVVRYRTESLFLTMLLHAVANAFATGEVVVQEHWLK